VATGAAGVGVTLGVTGAATGEAASPDRRITMTVGVVEVAAAVVGACAAPVVACAIAPMRASAAAALRLPAMIRPPVAAW
jgi:hypothetical protein